jgi:uncharacterized LabA/DUF88 family protein
MPFYNPPTTQAPKYIYIDGGYLRQRLQKYSDRYFSGEAVELDFLQLCSGYEKKFYYDCLPGQRNGESDGDYAARKEQVQSLFDSLSELPGFHVFEGSLSGEGGRARQKGVDVQLGVHMLTHAHRGIVRNATLLAGDADFTPLVEAVVAEGSYVTLWADRGSVARSLRRAADRYNEFDVFTIFNSTRNSMWEKSARPQVSNELGVAHGGWPHLKTGRLERGGEVNVYTNGSHCLLTFPKGQHVTHIRTASAQVAEKIAEDMGEKIVWL